MYKIIVAHPGQQHSYKTASALNKSGNLFKYVTTVYNKEHSRLMTFIKQIIGKKNGTRANNRRIDEIEDDKVVQFCELWGLITLLILRVDKTKTRVLYNTCNRWLSNRFGKKVARFAIKNRVDAVVCYDSNSQACFKILQKRAPHIIRIMDNAAPNRYGLFIEYQNINQKYRVIDKQPDAFKQFLVNEKKALYYQNEANLADFHIVASSFSKKMLENSGISNERIRVIPYGFNVNEKVINKSKYNDKIKFMFVGEISAQKGIFDYIDVASKFKERAEFHAVGGGIDNLRQSYKEMINNNIIYHGYVLKNELYELYNQMDVFVFPSLGDGFGFVVLEALSFGLPVICSKNSIGTDIIRDFYNGFLIEAGNTEQISEKIEWILENKDVLQKMSNNSKQSVCGYSWERYSKEINILIQDIMEERYVV